MRLALDAAVPVMSDRRSLRIAECRAERIFIGSMEPVLEWRGESESEAEPYEERGRRDVGEGRWRGGSFSMPDESLL
jgi:hypothetical protein